MCEKCKELEDQIYRLRCMVDTEPISELNNILKEIKLKTGEREILSANHNKFLKDTLNNTITLNKKMREVIKTMEGE